MVEARGVHALLEENELGPEESGPEEVPRPGPARKDMKRKASKALTLKDGTIFSLCNLRTY